MSGSVSGPLLLRGGRVVDPSQGFDGVSDVLLLEGRVEARGKGLSTPDGARVVECLSLIHI